MVDRAAWRWRWWAEGREARGSRAERARCMLAWLGVPRAAQQRARVVRVWHARAASTPRATGSSTAPKVPPHQTAQPLAWRGEDATAATPAAPGNPRGNTRAHDSQPEVEGHAVDDKVGRDPKGPHACAAHIAHYPSRASVERVIKVLRRRRGLTSTRQGGHAWRGGCPNPEACARCGAGNNSASCRRRVPKLSSQNVDLSCAKTCACLPSSSGGQIARASAAWQEPRRVGSSTRRNDQQRHDALARARAHAHAHTHTRTRTRTHTHAHIQTRARARARVGAWVHGCMARAVPC